MDILLLLSPFNILDSEIIKITSVSDLSLEIELVKGNVNYSFIEASDSTDKQCLLESGVSTCVITGLTPHTLYTVEVSGCDDNICTLLTGSMVFTKPSGMSTIH